MFKYFIFSFLFILSSCAENNHHGIIGLAVKDSKNYMKIRWKDTEICRKVSKVSGAKIIKVYGLEKANAGFDKIILLKNANFDLIAKDEELSKIFVKESDYFKLQNPLEESFKLSPDTCLFKLGNDIALCDKALKNKLSVLGKSYADDLYNELMDNSNEAVILVAPSSDQVDPEKLIEQASKNMGFSSTAYARGLKKNIETLKKMKSISVVTCNDESVKIKLEFKDSDLAQKAMTVFDGKAGSMSDFSLANKMKISFNNTAIPSLKINNSTISGLLKPKKGRVRLSRFIGTALQIYKIEIEGSKGEVPVKYASYKETEGELRDLTVEEVKKQLNETFKLGEGKYNKAFKKEYFEYSYSGLPKSQTSVYIEPKVYDIYNKELKSHADKSTNSFYVEYDPGKTKIGRVKLTLNARAKLKFDKFEFTKDDIGKVKSGKMSSVKLIKMDNDVYVIDYNGGYYINIDCLDEQGKALNKLNEDGTNNLSRRVSGKISKLKIVIVSPPEKISITKDFDLSK